MSVLWTVLIHRYLLQGPPPAESVNPPQKIKRSNNFIITTTTIIIIMSLTPVSSSYEDIGGVPSTQSCYSAGMKRCWICMEERSPLWVRRSKSEETLHARRLLITMVEETFDIRRSWVDHGRPVMNLKSGYVEGENSKWKVKQRKMGRTLGI